MTIDLTKIDPSQLDGGSVEFQDEGGNAIAVLPLKSPAFGEIEKDDNGALFRPLNGPVWDEKAKAGTIAKAVFKTPDAASMFAVTVTDNRGDGDILFPSVGVFEGDKVTMTQYYCPA